MRATEFITEQGVAEGATITRIDSKPITDFGSSLKAYKHTDDWSQSGVDTGDDSYWKNKNLKTNTTKGLFAGDPKRTALYATGNAHETRYVEFTQDGQPIVYFDRKDLPAMRSRKTYLTVFDANDFRQLPTGEWFSENPSKPIKQVPIGDPFKYIASQGWIVRVTDDLDKVFKQVKNMHKAGKIVQYGAEGMNESKQGVAEDRENFNGINLLLQKDDEELFVKASAGSRELGHVLFVIDGDYLMPQDLEVDERFRGQGIAQTMYDYVKSKGYKIRRSGQQTDAGAGFWNKHRAAQNVWEQDDSEVKSHDFMAGHCHVMALALKQLHPDWQIRAHVGYDDDEADDAEYRVDHVYTVAPDGTAYDCRGRFDNEQQLVGPDTTGGVDTQYVNFGPEEIKQAMLRGELKRFTKQDLDNAMQTATQIGKD